MERSGGRTEEREGWHSDRTSGPSVIQLSRHYNPITLAGVDCFRQISYLCVI